MNLTPEALYRYQERLGILCGDATPTPYQHDIALQDALRADEGLPPDYPRPHVVTPPPSPILPAE